MKWNLSVPESGMLMYYLVKFTGLAPFTALHAPDFLSKLYPLFVAVGYSLYVSVSYPSVLEALTSEESSLLLKTWLTILHFMSLPGAFITLVIFLIRHENITYLLNTLRTVSIELESLGIEEDHEKSLKKLFVNTLMTHAVLSAMLGTAILMETQMSMLVSINYCFENWFNFNTVLIFAGMLIWIRQRFTVMNEKFYDLLKPTHGLTIPHQSRLFIIGINTEEASQPGDNDLTDLHRHREIQALHFKLCDLVDRTTRLFNVPIILLNIRHFITLMSHFYRMYLIVRYSDCNGDTTKLSYGIADMLCSVVKIGMPIVELLIIAHASATTREQGNAMRAVLFKVWIKLRPRQLTHEFLKFSHQLLHKPVAISVFGFLNPDYSLIFKIFCIKQPT